MLTTETLVDAEAAARRAAKIVAEEARAAVAARGRFVIAVSGGNTPMAMLRSLAAEPVPWYSTHFFQVDERIAPPADPDRNITQLRESLLRNCALPAEQIHAMPVERTNLDAAAEWYAGELERFAGAPFALDLIHLGLGADGHTASLVPGDAALEEAARDVALSGVYRGRRRMTLTLPAINRARRVLWLVTGVEKAEALALLRRADPSIPAGRVSQENATIIADIAAAGRSPDD